MSKTVGLLRQGVRQLSRGIIDDAAMGATPSAIKTDGQYDQFLRDPIFIPDPSVELYAKQRNVIPLGQHVPDIAQDSFISPSSNLIGDVTVRDRASVWNGAVLRGDLNNVYLGGFSNIQERSVLTSRIEIDTGLDARTTVGNWVTVSPGVSISAATVHSFTHIGAKATVEPGAIIEPYSVVAAGSVVPAGTIIPTGEIWGGSHSSNSSNSSNSSIAFIRKVGPNEKAAFKEEAEAYWEIAEDHKEQYMPYNSALWEKEDIDRMEADARAEFVEEMRARIKQQNEELREKLESKREKFVKAGALGEAREE